MSGAVLGFVAGRMTDHHHNRHHFYSVGDESPSSILWDLDSSSLIVPASCRPIPEQQQPSVYREISEESGYQTSSAGIAEDATPSWMVDSQSWNCPPPPPSISFHQDDESCSWLIQQHEESSILAGTSGGDDQSWEEILICPDKDQVIHQQSIIPSIRKDSTSSDESDIYVPSGKFKIYFNDSFFLK